MNIVGFSETKRPGNGEVRSQGYITICQVRAMKFVLKDGQDSFLDDRSLLLLGLLLLMSL